MHADKTAVQGAGTDGHVVIGKSVEKLAGFFDGRGEIRVRNEHNAAASFEHAMPDAVALATILAIRKHTQTGKFGTKGMGNIRGAVGRTVVNDDDFRFPMTQADVGGNLRESYGGAKLLVEGGYNDGELGRSSSHLEG